MRSGNIVSINVTLKPGLNIRDIHSNSHEISITNAIADTYQIILKNKDEIPNRDFILEYTAAKDNEPTAALFTSELDGDDYFMLMAIPPIQKNPKTSSLEISPLSLMCPVLWMGSLWSRLNQVLNMP